MGAFCRRSNWAAIQATAAPSSAEGVDCSKFFSMASSVWQCAQPARWAAALGSVEAFSVIRSSTSSGRHSWVAEAASCHIFAVFVLSAMTISSAVPLSSCLPAFCCFIQLPFGAYQVGFRTAGVCQVEHARNYVQRKLFPKVHGKNGFLSFFERFIN